VPRRASKAGHDGLPNAPTAEQRAAAARRRRRRRWRGALLVLILIVAGGAVAIHLLLQPERVSALLVDKARAAGLELQLAGGAHYRYTPHIVAVLPALRLRTSAGDELLRAQALRVQVPWRTLWSQPLTLDELGIEQPVLDLAVLRAWLATRPSDAAPMPDLRLQLHVSDGRIVDGTQAVASGIDARLRNSADLAAWLAQWASPPALPQLLPPISGSLRAGSLDVGDTHVEDLRIEASEAAPPQQP